MREGTVTLADGRRLGYAEYGDPDGIPIFEFHGVPGGRFYQLRHDALVAAGARLLTLERPGFGLSDPNPGRGLLDWPNDVAEAADHFGFDRVAVVGMSMGAPNALATAFALPERVAIAGLVCGVGPCFDNPQFDPLLPPTYEALLPIARADRAAAVELVRDFMKPAAEAWAEDPDAFFETFVLEWQEIDQPAFRANREQWMASLQATWQRGTDTTVEEISASVGPWEFSPNEIHVPVHAWHGTADHMPVEPIRFVVDQAPHAQLTEYPGEGHMLDESHHDDWLEVLTQWAR